MEFDMKKLLEDKDKLKMNIEKALRLSIPEIAHGGGDFSDIMIELTLNFMIKFTDLILYEKNLKP